MDDLPIPGFVLHSLKRIPPHWTCERFTRKLSRERAPGLLEIVEAGRVRAATTRRRQHGLERLSLARNCRASVNSVRSFCLHACACAEKRLARFPAFA